MFEKESITCVDVYTLLGQYVDCELPRALTGRIRDHIAECEYCQEVEGSYRMVIEGAKALRDQPMPLPEGAKERLRGALEERLGIDLSSRLKE